MRDSPIRLLPWVLDGKACVGPRMQDARFGTPLVCEALQALPGHTMPLTPASERPEPDPFDRLSAGFHEPPLGGHSIVAIIAAPYAAEPRARFGAGLVPMPPEDVLALLALGAHLFLLGITLALVRPVAGSIPAMAEPEKREGRRLARSPPLPVGPGEATALEQAGFRRVELPGEGGPPGLQCVPKPGGIVVRLQPKHHVVRLAHHDHGAVGVTLTPLGRPEGQDGMRVQIAQQRRDPRALHDAPLWLGHATFLPHPSLEPFVDQAE